MTDKKFKEQLINLIKTDNEVRSLVCEVVKEDIESLILEIFVEKEQCKNVEIFSSDYVKQTDTIEDKIDAYFYNICRGIEDRRRIEFLNEINEELETTHQQKEGEQQREYMEEREFQQNKQYKDNAYLEAIPECKVDEDVLQSVYNYLINNRMIEGSFKHFMYFCRMKEGRYDLNWIDIKGYNNKSKKVCYPLLFDLMHNVVFNERKSFTDKRRKIFLLNIIEGMKFNGEYVKYSTLNTAYSNWINRYSLTGKIYNTMLGY